MANKVAFVYTRLECTAMTSEMNQFEWIQMENETNNQAKGKYWKAIKLAFDVAASLEHFAQ